MIALYFFLMVLVELIAASSQMLLKKSAGIKYPNIIREYLNPWVICGYGMLVLSMALTIVCYGKLGYMGVVVIEPINYAIVMVLSRIIFKEKITKKKLIGVALIMAGIIVFYALG